MALDLTIATYSWASAHLLVGEYLLYSISFSLLLSLSSLNNES
jgi:hypothetical protein